MTKRKPIPRAVHDSADEQRKHYFNWSTIQNLIGFLSILFAIASAYFGMKSDVRLNTQQIEQLQSQQKATWEAVRNLRERK